MNSVKLPRDLPDVSISVPVAALYRWAAICSASSGVLQGINIAFERNGMKPLETESASKLVDARDEIMASIAAALLPQVSQ